MGRIGDAGMKFMGTIYLIPLTSGQRQAAHLCGVDGMKPPKALETIADVVLAYRPKPKSKAAKRRKRKERKYAKGTV